MARQKHYIKTYNEKDRQAYLFLNNVYHCRPSQLQVFISQNRIKSWEKEKLIEKIKTANGDYYKPGSNFYKYLEQQFAKENYKYYSQSPDHDVMLAQKYIELYTSLGKDNFIWKNETDLKQEREYQLSELRDRGEWERAEMLRTAGVTDCVIQTRDTTYAYDVITSNYSQADIQSKIEYADSLQIQLITQRI